MFYRKTISIIAILILFSAVFVIPNTADAIWWLFDWELDCWPSICLPLGVSSHINKEGCTEISICTGVKYCEVIICPGEDNNDDDDTTGNNDDTTGNNDDTTGNNG